MLKPERQHRILDILHCFERLDLLKSAAGATTLPVFGQHEHPQSAPGSQPTAPAWKAKLFDAHQLETVAVLADRIIPATDTAGAREARVHEYIDLMLHDGPAEPRADFIKGLGWLDGYALRLHGEPFVRCNAADQQSILAALSRFTPGTGQTLNRAGTPDRAAEIDRPIKPPVRPGPATEADPDLSPGARFFLQVKMLTIDGYYTTPIGIQELNKGGRVPAGFGCHHDEHKG